MLWHGPHTLCWQSRPWLGIIYLLHHLYPSCLGPLHEHSGLQGCIQGRIACCQKGVYGPQGLL